MRKLLQFLNGLVTVVVTLALLTAGAYAGYALWDNQQVYNAAENVFAEMKEIRAAMSMPTATPAPTAAPAALPSQEEAPAATAAPVLAEATATPQPENLSPFAQLKAINPDVTGWITVPGTAIDYPVMQGPSNYSYINTDVYGNFALAGSIFLDSRNDGEYRDRYSLLYGHNMSQHRMFSDVNLFKDEKFFRENTRGALLLPEGGHVLQSLSCIVTSASNSLLFNPGNWTRLDADAILRTVEENALFTDPEGMQALRDKLEAGEEPRIVALSTCSNEFTDARTILLTLMDPE